MVTLTARDIIKQAKWLSNTTNSPLTDFYINTYLLSSLYRDLYDDLVDNDNSFIQTVEASESFYLGDTYKVVYVEDQYGNELVRSSLRNRQTGGYYIENNTIYLPSGIYKIKYSPLPSTITVPDDYEEVIPAHKDMRQNYAVTEDGEVDGTIEPCVFKGETYEIGVYPSWTEREDSGYVNICVSDPYMIVSYEDGKVRVYTDSNAYSYYEFNPYTELSKGFNGYVLAFTANESNGKGLVYYDNLKEKYYYGSFLPNTVLSYPNNAFFTLLIYRLAAILASMVGLENPYLTNTLLPNAEVTFYKSISKGKSTRIANTMGVSYVRR